MGCEWFFRIFLGGWVGLVFLWLGVGVRVRVWALMLTGIDG